MPKFTKIFLILASIYIVLGLIFIALNDFSLTKGVSRFPYNLACANNQSVSGDEARALGCIETDDLRWSYHVTWINWQFFSKNRGADIAKYIPADILLLMLFGIGTYAFTRHRQSNRTK